MSLSPIIQAEELALILNQEKLIIIDVSNSKSAFQDYKNKHIKGALFVDLNSQLANIKPDTKDGGRHPLPELNEFQALLSTLGIFPESHVILYDTFSGSNAAARMWWMLKAVGHEKTQVLNGGLQAAEEIQIELESGENKVPQPSNYLIEQWNLPQVNIRELSEIINSGDGIVIDVRAKERYEGKIEPLDSVAGHIPTAINIPFTENLDQEGKFISPDLIREKYAYLLSKHPLKKQVVHCGSGVTACHTLLALAYAEIELPNLYVGSWSEWSRSDYDKITEITLANQIKKM
jgi:thiosulfate/3-mercaptopyruvate sulfurtransferase